MWSSFTLTSADPPAILAERLRADVNASDGFFRGTVDNDAFEATRRLGFERTFPIVVRGCFESTATGETTVPVRTRPLWSNLILVITVSGCLGTFAFKLNEQRGDWFAPYFFAGMIAFLWLLLWIGTVFEERQARSALIRILRAKGQVFLSPGQRPG